MSGVAGDPVFGRVRADVDVALETLRRMEAVDFDAVGQFAGDEALVRSVFTRMERLRAFLARLPGGDDAAS